MLTAFQYWIALESSFLVLEPDGDQSRPGPSRFVACFSHSSTSPASLAVLLPPPQPAISHLYPCTLTAVWVARAVVWVPSGCCKSQAVLCLPVLPTSPGFFATAVSLIKRWRTPQRLAPPAVLRLGVPVGAPRSSDN